MSVANIKMCKNMFNHATKHQSLLFTNRTKKWERCPHVWITHCDFFRLLECHEYKVFPPSEDLMFSIWTFSTNHPLSSSLRLVTVQLGTQELKPNSSRLNRFKIFELPACPTGVRQSTQHMKHQDTTMFSFIRSSHWFCIRSSASWKNF